VSKKSVRFDSHGQLMHWAMPCYGILRSVGWEFEEPSRNSWSLKLEPIFWPETSVRYHNSTLCNIPEERMSHVHRGGSLESCNSCIFCELSITTWL